MVRGHHQRPHAFRVAQRVAEAGPAAHRLPDEAHLGQPEVIEQRREVIDEGIRSWPAC